MAGPWRVPADGRSDRVMVGFAPLVALNLPSGTGSPAPARPRSDRRGSVARRAPFHEVRRPFSAPTLESSLPGTMARVRAYGEVPRPTACRPKATPRCPDDSDGAVRRPLPDDRRVGCRDERWPAPGGSVREGTAGVPRYRSRSPSRPAADRGPLWSVAITGVPRPHPLRGAGVGCTSRWVVVPRREFPGSLRSAYAVSHDLGGLPLSGVVRRVSSGHALGVLVRLESPTGRSVVGRPEGRSVRGVTRGRLRVAGMRSTAVGLRPSRPWRTRDAARSLPREHPPGGPALCQTLSRLTESAAMAPDMTGVSFRGGETRRSSRGRSCGAFVWSRGGQ